MRDKEAHVEQRLRKEIAKWSVRIGEKLHKTTAANARGREFLTNIRAYVKDSGHFMHEGDLVRSFEALIWSWAWLEIGLELGMLSESPGK